MMLPELNEAGFLKNREDWNGDVAFQLAYTLGLEITDGIWDLIYLVRAEYEKNGTVPVLREFSKMTGGDRKGTHLNKIFHGGPMKKLALIAGLPQPTGCV